MNPKTRNGKLGTLAEALVILSCCLVLLSACRRDPVSTATPAPSPTPTAVVTPPSPEPPALPDGAEALRQSQEQIMALPAVGLEAEYTAFLWPGAPPLTEAQTGCLRLGGGEDTDGPPSHTEIRVPGGVIRRGVCDDTGDERACYTQVADHAWFRDVTLERGPSWPGSRGEVLASATITESVADAGDGTLSVRWFKEDWPVDGVLLHGETWLAPDTLGPRREALRWYQGNMLVGTSEMTYTTCEPVTQVETWPPPTVTPAATVPPPAEQFDIREESTPLPGVLYVPQGEGPFPAVIVLHGSEGTVNGTDGVAQRLARGGLVAFAFCYFGCLDTPWTMENIEISRVSEALAYLRDRPDTAGEKVGVVGFSRGADLALTIGVLDETVGPVVSVMGFPWVYGSAASAAPAAAWIYQGDPLPFVAIPVEEIDGPVLLLHGQEDNTVPVSSAYIVAERLAAHDHEYELVVYAHRGHELGLAPRDVLNQTTRFLREHLVP